MAHADQTREKAVYSNTVSVAMDGHCDHTTDDPAQLAEDLQNLRLRMETLPVIEQSKGLLMGYWGIDPDAAFELLRRWSSHSNTKLRLISEALVAAATHRRPDETPQQALQRAIDRFAAADRVDVTTVLSGRMDGFRPENTA